MTHFFRRLLLIVGLAVSPTVAPAQTYTWTGSGSDAKWSTAGNWDASGIPQSGTGTTIALTGTSQTTSTFDLTNSVGSPFVVNKITTNQGFAVNAAVGGSINLSFAGPGAGVFRNVSNPSTDTTFAFNAQTLNLGDTTNTTTFNSGDGRTTGTNIELIVGGKLTGGGNLLLTTGSPTNATVAPLGSLVLNGLGGTTATNSTYSGTISMNGGMAYLGSANVISRTTTLDMTTASGTFGNTIFLGTRASTTTGFSTAASYGQQLGSLKTTSTTGQSNVLNLGDESSATGAAILVGFANANDSCHGQISSSTTAAAYANSHFGKVGTGTLTLGGVNPTNGGFSVRDGSVVLTGSGTLNGGATGATAITIYAGATLQSDNSTTSNNNRLPGTGTANANNAPISLAGGTLRLTGQTGAAAAYSELVSGFRLLSGQSTILIDNVPSSAAVRINASGTVGNGNGGLSQTGNSTATIFFNSTNLGQASSSSSTNQTGGVAFAVAPTLIGGGGAAGSQNISILPFGFGTGATTTGSLTSVPESFVTYDSANNSIRSLKDPSGGGEYATTFGTDTNNVSLSSAPAGSLGGATTANVLRLTTGGSVNTNGNTLTLTAGALLNNGGGDITGGGTIAFGGTSVATRTTAYITTNGAMGIASGIEAANLSKNGAGVLTLTGPVTLTSPASGTVAVNAGTLTLGTSATVTGVTTYQVSRSGNLDVSALGLTVGSGVSLTGGAGTVATGAANQATVTSGTVGNNKALMIASGGTISPSSLGGTATNLASPGTLTVTGDLKLNGGSSYIWNVNSAITNGDNTVAATTDTLANYRSPYTASNVVVSGTLDLTGADAASRVTLKINPLTLANGAATPGESAIYDFNPNTETSARHWLIVEAGVVDGFAVNKFNIDTSAFGAITSGGTFSISQVGNSLVLDFLPVPEPTSVLAVAACGLALASWRRRRNRQVAV